MDKLRIMKMYCTHFVKCICKRNIDMFYSEFRLKPSHLLFKLHDLVIINLKLCSLFARQIIILEHIFSCGHYRKTLSSEKLVVFHLITPIPKILGLTSTEIPRSQYSRLEPQLTVSFVAINEAIIIFYCKYVLKT